jgi:transposase
VAVDALGNPVRFILTGGERNDITQAGPLIEGLPARYVLADKAYDADPFRQAIQAQGAQAVIPLNRSRARYDDHDREIYKARNLVERFSTSSITSVASQTDTNRPQEPISQWSNSPLSSYGRGECQRCLGAFRPHEHRAAGVSGPHFGEPNVALELFRGPVRTHRTHGAVPADFARRQGLEQRRDRGG